MSRKTQIDTPADGPRVKISALAVRAALLTLQYPRETHRIPAPVACYQNGVIVGWMDGRAKG